MLSNTAKLCVCPPSEFNRVLAHESSCASLKTLVSRGLLGLCLSRSQRRLQLQTKQIIRRVHFQRVQQEKIFSFSGARNRPALPLYATKQVVPILHLPEMLPK